MLASIRHALYRTVSWCARPPVAAFSWAAIAALLVTGCATAQRSDPPAARPPAPATSTAPAAAWTPPPARASGLTARLAGDTAVAPGSVPATSALVLSTADELVGTRYRYGGSTPEGGFDCSGFVRWVFSRHGIDLPRTARAMGAAGHRIPARRTELSPGDLLLFAERGANVSHVAIYLGGGRIVHASSGQGAVRYDDLDSARGRWFRRHVVSARRVISAE